MTTLCNEPENHCSKFSKSEEKNIFTFSPGPNLSTVRVREQYDRILLLEAESVHHKTGNGGARISLFFRYIPEFYFREWIHKIRIFGTGKSPGQIESSDKTWHELTIHPQ